MIYFEKDGTGYAVDSAELAGVAVGCPFTSHPRLPDGVAGIVQWSGKILPVIQVFPDAQPKPNWTFLFSTEGLLREPGAFPEIAIAVPGSVRVFVPVETGAAPAGSFHGVVGTARDENGVNAWILSLAQLVKSPRRKAIDHAA